MDSLPGGFIVKKLPIQDMPATNVVRKGLIYTYYYKNSNKCQHYNDLKKMKTQKKQTNFIILSFQFICNLLFLEIVYTIIF